MGLQKKNWAMGIGVFALTTLSVLYLWILLDRPNMGTDDANIFFVYVENFANGNGFVYNVGGEKVEGFTSLLWVIIGAAAYKITSTQFEWVLLLFNISLVSLSTVFVVRYLATRQRHSQIPTFFLPALYVVLLLTTPSYLTWMTVSLMDNGVWSALLLATTLLIVGSPSGDISGKFRIYFALLIVLLILTRPESFAYVPLFIAIYFAKNYFTLGLLRSIKEAAVYSLVFLMAVLSLTAFRLWYFGYPLPNTFYAKVDGSLAYNISQGSAYFREYLFSNPLVIVSIFSAVFLSLYIVYEFFSGNKQHKNGDLLPVVAMAGLLLPVITGGDHFALSRFYQNTFPILLLCFIQLLNLFVGYLLERFSDASGNLKGIRFSAILLIAGALILGFLEFPTASDWAQHKAEYELADLGRITGSTIEDVFSGMPILPDIGIYKAGGIKYEYAGNAIDLLGLNNVAMAHSSRERQGFKNHASFDKSVFYEIDLDIFNPVLIDDQWTYSKEAVLNSFANEVFDYLYDDDLFLAQYKYLRVNKGEHSLVGWFSHEFAEALAASDLLEVIDPTQFRDKDCFASLVDEAANDSLDIALGERFILRNFEFTQYINESEAIKVTLVLQALERTKTNYTTFFHLLDSSGNLVAQNDRAAGCDNAGTSTWRDGEMWQDTYEIVLPADLAAGEYSLVAGMYGWPSLERLPIANSPTDTILLGELQLNRQ